MSQRDLRQSSLRSVDSSLRAVSIEASHLPVTAGFWRSGSFRSGKNAMVYLECGGTCNAVLAAAAKRPRTNERPLALDALKQKLPHRALQALKRDGERMIHVDVTGINVNLSLIHI